ncbi:MAG: hypothetical protein H6Q15_1162 [Bacteroidetes bacterium]|nr:hypothetical protein [Bacteroidota bacterium]
MSHFYRPNRKLFKTKDGQVQEKYYACATRFSQIKTKRVASDIMDLSSLSKGDVLNSLSSLSDVLRSHLSLGHSVKLDGIGTFSISITSNPSDDPEKIDARSIKVSKICFRADPELVQRLQEIDFVKEPAPPKGAIIKTK